MASRTPTSGSGIAKAGDGAPSLAQLGEDFVGPAADAGLQLDLLGEDLRAEDVFDLVLEGLSVRAHLVEMAGAYQVSSALVKISSRITTTTSFRQIALALVGPRP